MTSTQGMQMSIKEATCMAAKETQGTQNMTSVQGMQISIKEATCLAAEETQGTRNMTSVQGTRRLVHCTYLGR